MLDNQGLRFTNAPPINIGSDPRNKRRDPPARKRFGIIMLLVLECFGRLLLYNGHITYVADLTHAYNNMAKNMPCCLLNICYVVCKVCKYTLSFSENMLNAIFSQKNVVKIKLFCFSFLCKACGRVQTIILLCPAQICINTTIHVRPPKSSRTIHHSLLNHSKCTTWRHLIKFNHRCCGFICYGFQCKCFSTWCDVAMRRSLRLIINS